MSECKEQQLSLREISVDKVDFRSWLRVPDTIMSECKEQQLSLREISVYKVDFRSWLGVPDTILCAQVLTFTNGWLFS
jgi:hypothetical protein